MDKVLLARNVDFKQLENDLQAAGSLTGRLEIMYKIALDQGFYCKIILKAVNAECVYGLDINNPVQAGVVGNFLLKNQVEKRYKATKDTLAARISSYELEEKKSLIEGELKLIKIPIQQMESVNINIEGQTADRSCMAYYIGYISAQTKRTPTFPSDLDRSYYEMVERGIICYRLEKFLASELAELDNNLKIFINADSNINVFNSANAALLFYKETGIYEALLNKFKSKAKVARIISTLTNIKPQLIEGLLSKIDFQKSNDKKNNPYTDKSIIETMELLSKLDIDTSNLLKIKNIISKE